MSNQSATIDLRSVITKADMHALFKEDLGFPDEWYGPSWDAFWGCIVVVAMPTEVRLVR